MSFSSSRWNHKEGNRGTRDQWNKRKWIGHQRSRSSRGGYQRTGEHGSRGGHHTGNVGETDAGTMGWDRSDDGFSRPSVLKNSRSLGNNVHAQSHRAIPTLYIV